MLKDLGVPAGALIVMDRGIALDANLCDLSARQAKEEAIDARLCARFEAELKRLAEGLTRPRGEKRPDRIHERIGRLKASCQGVAQHYVIEVETDANNSRVLKLTWEKKPAEGTRLAAPGVYCLRSNETTWSEAQLWRT